jgi:hypothetical protein
VAQPFFFAIVNQSFFRFCQSFFAAMTQSFLDFVNHFLVFVACYSESTILLQCPARFLLR